MLIRVRISVVTLGGCDPIRHQSTIPGRAHNPGELKIPNVSLRAGWQATHPLQALTPHRALLFKPDEGGEPIELASAKNDTWMRVTTLQPLRYLSQGGNGKFSLHIRYRPSHFD